MKTVRRISKRYYLRQIIACFLTCYMVLGMPLQVAMADPDPVAGVAPNSGNVISNTVPMDWTGSDGVNQQIGTAAGNNVIAWNNFDIGAGASVTFTQSGGWILNNVQAADGMATGINGGLFGANCGLIVLNTQGVTFGPTAMVSAQSFIASALNMDTSDFLAGDFDFGTMPGPKGNILVKNGAQIGAAEYLGLIGKNILSKGKLVGTGPDTKIIIAAADEVYVTENGSNISVQFEVEGPGLNELKLDVDSEVDAPGGELILAAGDIWSGAIVGVESLRAEAEFTGHFTGPITAEASAASDAVTEIDISTGGDLTIDDDITATAVGNGVDDAIATITLESTGGSVTITSDGAPGTTIKATASQGVNNDAKVEIKADGDVTLLAPDTVTVKAEAGFGTTLPLAKILTLALFSSP